MRKIFSCKLWVMLVWVALVCNAAQAQTTSFTYQGKLTDGGAPATGPYDLQFKLYDALTNGSLQGSPNTVTIAGQQVTNGVFTAQLDFGASAFPGADRFLEISVKRPADSSFTPLSPRQPITATPYALKSLNATNADAATNSTQLGGVAASQYVVTTDLRLTDERNPLPNSANYIQNNPVQAQTGGFLINGNGIVSGTLVGNLVNGNVVNAATQYNLGGQHVLSAAAGAENLFAGLNAGTNTTGVRNSFFGASAGLSNTMGEANSFFGRDAGFANTTGNFNSFFGTNAGSGNSTGNANSFFGTSAGNHNTTGANNAFFGQSAGFTNTTGNFNSFFGNEAGLGNTTGTGNSFFGSSAGGKNTTGFFNSFFGTSAGGDNTTGRFNSFFGESAGLSNTTGRGNSFFGESAGLGNTAGTNNTMIGTLANLSDNLDNASAIGARAMVTQSNSLVLGGINGINGAGADTNVGIGTTAPGYKLDVVGRLRFRQNAGETGPTNTAGLWLFQNTPAADRAFVGMESDNSVGFFGNNGGGWGLVMDTSTGFVKLRNLGAGGTNVLCRNGTNEISTCSSSLRYKTNVSRFAAGLSFVSQLRPISFDWKTDGTRDVGFGAEDVARIDPRFVTYNSKGEVEGVKYDRLTVVLVNAVNQQQSQIERQQREIEALKKLVCSMSPSAEICKAKHQ